MSTPPTRTQLPAERPGITHEFCIRTVTGPVCGIIWVGMFEDGVPIKDVVAKFRGFDFDPKGFTDNPTIGHAKSVVDYATRWLEQKFVDPEP